MISSKCKHTVISNSISEESSQTCYKEMSLGTGAWKVNREQKPQAEGEVSMAILEVGTTPKVVANWHCYIAGVFPATARPFIG